MIPKEVQRLRDGAQKSVTACGSGELVWHCWGNGEPLVLLHGGFGSWLHWIRNIDSLAPSFQVCAVDIPGLGESGDPPEPITPESLASIIVKGIRTLFGDRRIRLVGFSFGGLIAGVVAKQLGSQASHCVLVGASGTGLPRPALELVRRDPSMTTAQLEAAHRNNLRVLMLHRPQSVDRLAVYIHALNDRQARLRSRRMSMTDALAKTLGSIDARLCGIWGAHDATSAPWTDERRQLLRAHQPSAAFHVIDAGHWVQYEAAEEFNRILAIELGSAGLLLEPHPTT